MNLDLVAPRVGFSNPRRYEERARFLFDGVEIADRRILDVGCGHGAATVWAALHGAASVVALEPEMDGSTPGSATALPQVIADLGLEDRVELHRLRLDQFEDDVPFDVAILDSVVNHLNEAAVPYLHSDPAAVDEYVATLRPLRALLRPGGLVIVADCGRRSIWNAVGHQGPWTRDIEWDKHQQPHTCIDVFRRAGFAPHDVRWMPVRWTGRLTGNRVVQYFTMAHFVLRMRAV
jgi:SAM-dependent methyltransferase